MLYVLGPKKINEECQIKALITSWLDSKKSVQDVEDAINLLNKIDLDSKKEKAINYPYIVRYHAAAQDASRLYERLAFANFPPINKALSHEAQLMAELKKRGLYFNFDAAFTRTRMKSTTKLDAQFMKTVHTSLTTAYKKLTDTLPQKRQLLLTNNQKESIQGQKDRLFGTTPQRNSPKNNKQTIPNNHNEDLLFIINSITNLDFNLHYGFGSKIKNGQRVSRGAAEIYNITLEALTNPSSANISDTFDKIHKILGTKTQPRWTLLGLGQRDHTTTELYQKLEDLVCAKRKVLNSENESSLIPRIMK